MSRRNISKKRFPQTDEIYNSYLVSLLITRILKSGKKTIAKKIIEKDTLIEVRAYAHSSVGFYHCYHYDVDIAIDKMLNKIKYLRCIAAALCAVATGNAAAAGLEKLPDELHTKIAEFYQTQVAQHIRGPY